MAYNPILCVIAIGLGLGLWWLNNHIYPYHPICDYQNLVEIEMTIIDLPHPGSERPTVRFEQIMYHKGRG